MHNYTLQTKNPSVALGGFGQDRFSYRYSTIRYGEPIKTPS